MANKDYTYIVTANEAFHDEAVAFTKKEALILQRKLQKIEEDESFDDNPPGDVRVYKLVLVA